jgi:O-antigen/teichoic acid export membrane protein
MLPKLSDHALRILNIALRFATLVTKLGLTLYMGRYLTLADMGIFGLVSGAVVTLTTVLGMRHDFVVSRELVGATPTVVLRKMRDQAVFYGFNYLALAIVMGVLVAMDASGVTPKVMLAIFVLSVVESCAGMTFLNLTSLGQPLTANTMFFIRAGAWVFPAVALGVLLPAWRTADALFLCWAVGVIVSLIATVWAWRKLPWGEVSRLAVNWAWVREGVKRCAFIWLGSLGTTIGFYIDRFIVAHNLGLDLAGVATFYSSFTTALFALVQSGVLAFTYPKLILLHQEKDEAGFKALAWKLGWQVAVFAGVVAIAIGTAVPLFGNYFGHAILVQEAPTLWLMLFGMWLRANATTLYYVLFARHQDRAIWLGDLLFLVPAFGCNALLVPMIGISGIGWGAIVASLFLLVWRGSYVMNGKGVKSGDALSPTP